MLKDPYRICTDNKQTNSTSKTTPTIASVNPFVFSFRVVPHEGKSGRPAYTNGRVHVLSRVLVCIRIVIVYRIVNNNDDSNKQTTQQKRTVETLLCVATVLSATRLSLSQACTVYVCERRGKGPKAAWLSISLVNSSHAVKTPCSIHAEGEGVLGCTLVKWDAG